MKKKTKDKQLYSVDVAVTFFLEKEVFAEDEDQAHQEVEHSIDRKTILTAWDSGDFEVECIDSEVIEEEDEDNE